jgi:hypothetical protein
VPESQTALGARQVPPLVPKQQVTPRSPHLMHVPVVEVPEHRVPGAVQVTFKPLVFWQQRSPGAPQLVPCAGTHAPAVHVPGMVPQDAPVATHCP